MASLSVEATADPGLLRVDGRLAARFASLSEAAAAVRSGSLRSDVGLLLVEEDGLGDAIGFAAYVPSARAGTVGLSETYAALVCTGANP
jgi:hypothetical protein